MFSFIRPVKLTAAIASCIVISRVIAEVLSVYFISPAITAVTAGYGTSRADGLWQWLMSVDPSASKLRTTLLWMVASQAVLGVLIYLRNVWDTKFSMRTVFHIRGAVYDRLQNVDQSFHDRMTSGQLINRAISDLQNVRSFINTGLLTTLDVGATILAYMLLLFTRSPWLMLAMLAPLPFWSWMMIRFGKKMNPVYRAQQESLDHLMGAVNEGLAGVHVVRAFGKEGREAERLNLLNRRLLEKFFESIRIQSRLTPALRLVTTGVHIGLFVLSAWLIHRGQMQIGDLMILGLAMSAILSKLQLVNQMTEIYQRALVSARRLFEILDTPPLTAGALAPIPAVIFPRAEVVLSDVTFGYDPARPVLKKVNARLPGGKITALIGPTGSGKSTLASLLARFYDPQQGSIWIDGKNLRSIPVKDLRRNVGIVFQETFLFSDTIRNNIRYGRSDVSEEMLRNAARAAHVEEFIESLPSGYDTRLGERGVQLSGGQRQRLAVARALVYDPRILILDDATASLDSRAEKAVRTLLRPLMEGRTVLLIAHRQNAIGDADQVLALEDGRIQAWAETGVGLPILPIPSVIEQVTL